MSPKKTASGSTQQARAAAPPSKADEGATCAAVTTKGTQCRLKAKEGSSFCARHQDAVSTNGQAAPAAKTVDKKVAKKTVKKTSRKASQVTRSEAQGNKVAKKTAAKKTAAKKAPAKKAAKKSAANKTTKKSAAASPTVSSGGAASGATGKGLKGRVKNAVKSLTGRRGK